jgi:hypothetical protein
MVVVGLVFAVHLGVAMREVSRSRCPIEPQQHPAGPPSRDAELQAEFSAEDIERLRGVKLWVLWYEDRFDLENTDSFGIAVHLTEDSARAALEKTGRPLQPGWDGYTVEGPDDALQTVLLGAQRAAVLRAVLERVKSGATDPIPMHS